MNPQYINKHFFSYTVIVLMVLAVGASIVRFTVNQDYLVSYEGDCDPYSQSCFLYCEDEACIDPFYYSIIERGAAEIYALCGQDVTTCDAAYECQPNVTYCKIRYCNPVVDKGECEQLTAEAENLEQKIDKI